MVSIQELPKKCYHDYITFSLWSGSGQTNGPMDVKITYYLCARLNFTFNLIVRTQQS